MGRTTNRIRKLSGAFRSAGILCLLLLLLTAAMRRNAAVWDDDVSLWADAAAKSPGKSRVHYNLGKSLYSAGMLAEAEAALLRALQLVEEPRLTSDVLCSLGDVYTAQGNHEQAVSVYLQVLEMSDGDVVALNNLGLLLLETGNNIDAERLFRRAVLADPNDSRSYLNLGRSLAAQGRDADAAAYFAAARALGFYKIPK